jgi:hypothetical protein
MGFYLDKREISQEIENLEGYYPVLKKLPKKIYCEYQNSWFGFSCILKINDNYKLIISNISESYFEKKSSLLKRIFRKNILTVDWDLISHLRERIFCLLQERDRIILTRQENKKKKKFFKLGGK